MARWSMFAALLLGVQNRWENMKQSKQSAIGTTLEVVPHCRLLEDVDFPGRDVASSSLKLTDV